MNDLKSGGPFLIHMGNTAALQFLTQTGEPGTYYHIPFIGTYMFCLSHSPSEWHTYTIQVSRLESPLTGLLPFIYTD
jgi:hypothetical protein